LTSENITRCFGMDITVTAIDDRWMATARQ